MSAMTAAHHDQKYIDLVKKAQAFNTDKEDDNGFLSSEDSQTFDKMMADAQQHKDRAEQIRKAEVEAAAIKEIAPVESPVNPSTTPKAQDETEKKFVKVRQGFDRATGLPKYVELDVTNNVRASDDYRQAFMTYLKTGQKQASLQSDDAEQAGYLIADQQFAAGLLKAVDDILYVRQHAKITTLTTAKTLGIRKRIAKASTWAWGAELQQPTPDTSLKYGKKALEPHYATGQLDYSNDLLRAAEVDVEQEVQDEMAADGAELMEDAYLLGNGDQRPLGVYVASDSGISTARDVVTGSATGFTSDGLINAKFALKKQYRNGGSRSGARWNFHRDALSIISKLKDNDNQYLFRVGVGRAQDGRAPEDMLLEMPVDESERVPNTYTSGNYAGGLFNWSYYHIADALDMSFQVLRELKALENLTVMLGRLKTDGLPKLEEAFVRLKCGT